MAEKYEKVDAVVIGAGLAGIVTALELLNTGKKVALIDRDIPEKLGGLARWSFGGMFFVNSDHQKKRGIRDSVDLALRDWNSFAEFGEGDHWPRKWAEQYVHQCTDEVYRWLLTQGVSFFPVVHWVERGLHQPGNSVPRFHMAWGTGQGLTDTLIARLQNHPKRDNLRLEFGFKVEEIITGSNGAEGVRGVKEANGETFEVYAENVVVAAGGITGNIEMVKKHWYKPWGEPPETILNGSHPVADGALHLEVERLNGNLTHLDKAWHYAAGVHHPNPKFENHGLSLVPVKSGLWLNYQGQRMGPIPLVSAFDTRYLVERICQEPVKYSWQVYNRKIAVKEMAVSGSEFNDGFRDKDYLKVLKTVLFGNKNLVDHLLKNCKDFVVANSIDELADKMNALTGEGHVQKDLLRDSIRHYDEMLGRGKKYHNDEQLRRISQLRQYTGDKLRVSKYAKIEDKSALPLIAVREFILSRKSLGGIQTDLECRVLTRPGSNPKPETIPGLYAVGEAAGFGGGGMHGLRSLEGTFLGGCVFTGRIAAKAISGKKL
ncbi:MAG: FAD-binding dehydrogenase [Bacteroidia bacterium]|nr:FAD-binding dehydrogenase [Bacteroidia bacterium]